MAGGRATIDDVADRAAVSRQTVSRVVNGSGPVRPDTRRRVLEAVAELGWTPDAHARALGSRPKAHADRTVA